MRSTACSADAPLLSHLALNTLSCAWVSIAPSRAATSRSLPHARINEVGATDAIHGRVRGHEITTGLLPLNPAPSRARAEILGGLARDVNEGAWVTGDLQVLHDLIHEALPLNRP